MTLSFTPSAPLTLGAEIEVQLIDWKNRNLCAVSKRILKQLGLNHPNIKAELFQSMVEINTGICTQVSEIKTDLEKSLAELQTVTDPLGIEIAMAGTHPFSRQKERLVYPTTRYHQLLEDKQWLARRLLIFGLHIHVGMENGDQAMALMSALLPYLPYLQALSSSSPFRHEQDTGLASVRTSIFESVPNAGMPSLFPHWQAFTNFYEMMIQSKSITGLKDLWWDVRPNPEYGTIEIRVFDCPSTLTEITACTALLQCLSAFLLDQIKEKGSLPPAPFFWYRENKWRATRWGIHTEFIQNEQGKTAPLQNILDELLRVLEPYAHRLHCTTELQKIPSFFDCGTSSERQRKIYEKTGSFEAVVDELLQECQTDQRTLLI